MRTIFACAWRGEDVPKSSLKYEPADVLKLWRGAERHVANARLVVLVDDYYYDRIRSLDAHDPKTLVLCRFREPDIGGWSRMFEVFHVACSQLELSWTGRNALLVGLDTVFWGNCDWLFDWDAAPLGLPHDPYHTHRPCDGVSVFSREGARLVWKEYVRVRDVRPFPYRLFGKPSEMVLMQHLWARHHWPFLEPDGERLLSYKVHLDTGRKRVPDDCSLVYFHGDPKPCDLPAEHEVREKWERA